MVAPIRNIGNKFFLSSANTNSQQNMTLPTITLSTNIRMDLSYRNIFDNYDEVRGRTFSPKPQSFRVSSMSSTKSLVIYHERMENNNNLEEDVNIEFLNSPQLLYATLKEQANQVIMVADSSTNMINQHIPIKCPNSSPSHVDDNVINIQLLYNPNAPTEPKL